MPALLSSQQHSRGSPAGKKTDEYKKQHFPRNQHVLTNRENNIFK